MPKVRGNPKPTPLQRNIPVSKCRKWELRVSVGKNLASGKYSTMTRRFNGTLSEANKAMRGFISEIENGHVLRKTGMTLEDYSVAWIEECRTKKRYAYNTWMKFVGHLRCVNRLIGKALVSDVDADMLDWVFERLEAGDTPSGKPASGTYMHDIAATLHLMMKAAVKDKHIPTNPCEYADVPGRDTKERKTINHDEMVDLISKLDPRVPVQFVLRTMVRSGMRREEVVGLDVLDIDFDQKVIHDRYGSDVLGRKDTKTPASVRDLPLTKSIEEDILERLAQIEKDFEEIREDSGTGYPVICESTPLVCDRTGERLKPDAVTHWWRKNRERLGYPGITPHDLRHSYLSELARRKVEPKALQCIAGHADFRTTMNVYIHVDMEDKRRAVEAVDW